MTGTSRPAWSPRRRSTAILIPPSIAFVVYGVITEVSIPALFAGGVFPGLVAGAGARRPGLLHLPEARLGRRTVGDAPRARSGGLGANWGLMAPVVILGSMYGGICTPTEAAVIAVVYGILLRVDRERTIGWKQLYQSMLDSAITSSVVMFIVAFAGLFGWTADHVGAIDHVLKSMLSLTQNPCDDSARQLVLFIAGMLLDAISIFYVFMPIFIPMMKHFGWDPLWFGVVMTYNLAIGMATPPVAVNLYVTSKLSETTLDRVAVAVVPFVLAMIGGAARGHLLPVAVPGATDLVRAVQARAVTGARTSD